MADKRTKLPTFEVDKQGLAKLLERKGKEFAVGELIQNAWDEDVKEVVVKLDDAGDGLYRLEVADDSPEGFSDLTHAYTLFADSKKKDDPEKRGRFNLGEKLVIAMCERASIETTKGSVHFDGESRVMSDYTTTSGSIFTGMVRLTDAEVAAVERLVYRLLPPEGIKTTFNGKLIARREPRYVFEISLRTERADEEGYLRPTTRKTTVQVYERQGDERGSLYEMGIPVVETGDSYHVNVEQKVPLNTDRDNVPPSYMRDVRAAVLNAIHANLDSETAGENWVDDALEDDSVAPEAVQSVVTARYGEKVVTADPSDREAEKIAVSEGYTVIPAGGFSKGAWGAVRGAGAALPAGQVTPSPDPSAGDNVLNLMPEDQWPTVVADLAEYAKVLAERVLGVELTVRIAQPKRRTDWPYNATWGRKSSTRAELTFNFTALGYPFFEKAMGGGPVVEAQMVSDRAHELLIHEFSHQYAEEHLSREFYDACCKVGAKLAGVLAADPTLKFKVVTREGVAA
jgi:hypothetical protein